MAQTAGQKNDGSDRLASADVGDQAPGRQFKRMPSPGEPAPWLRAPTSENPHFSFDMLGGRRVVLCFFGDIPATELRRLLGRGREADPRLASAGGVFFGVSTLQGDAHAPPLKALLAVGQLFLDRDRSVSRLYGISATDGAMDAYRPASFVVGQRLRVLDVVPLGNAGHSHVERLLRTLETLPAQEPVRMAGVPAPVLVVPWVFEPRLCRALIDYYEREGGEPSGVMRDVDGSTVLVHDERHKRRRDRATEDAQLRNACMNRIHE